MRKPNAQSPDPNVSVIIVCWNSAAYLPRCLSALAAQSYKDFEVVIMDNGSTDGGISDLEGKYPELDLTIKKLGSNLGFAAANNLGARLARGRWLALLNADAFPEPDWLEKLLRAAEHYPEFSFFASRQLQADAPHLLDGTRDVYHINVLVWRRRHNQVGVNVSHQVIDALRGVRRMFCPAF